MACFLIVNFIFAWLNWGIGNPKKKLHTRYAYLPSMAWMIYMMILSGNVLYYQVTNQMSLHELETARITNIAAKDVEKV